MNGLIFLRGLSTVTYHSCLGVEEVCVKITLPSGVWSTLVFTASMTGGITVESERKRRMSNALRVLSEVRMRSVMQSLAKLDKYLEHVEISFGFDHDSQSLRISMRGLRAGELYHFRSNISLLNFCHTNVETAESMIYEALADGYMNVKQLADGPGGE
jgi:hypothetical protein